MEHTTAKLNLGNFPNPDFPGNKGLVVRVIWYLMNAIVLQSRLPLLPSGAKAALLRLFGARVGRGAVIKPRVTIKYPWFLELGANVWIGEGVWIDNPGMVTVGANVCISQDAYLVTGNHDFTRDDFRFFSQPVTVGERTWICAKAIVPPGSVIPANTVVPIGSVWRNPSEPS